MVCVCVRDKREMEAVETRIDAGHGVSKSFEQMSNAETISVKEIFRSSTTGLSFAASARRGALPSIPLLSSARQ